MALDGALRQVYPAGYLAVGEAAGGQQQDLELPDGEHALRALLGLLQYLAGHAQNHVAVLGGEDRRADRRHELGRGRVL